ncbi:helix-turn-helix domain-containing protein [Rhodococcus sp. IEGM 1354]|uniref:helix-turn-helix domain-containing protein n=1 Tax=Rhodococcus sp. IEGM 1354 TaxID=3047088 RepID=UPI003FA73E06
MERVLRELARFDNSGESALTIVASLQHISERNLWDETDIVIAMAQHSGHPARIALEKGVYLRSDQTGALSHVTVPPHKQWPAERITAGGDDSIWLERMGPITLAEAVILHSSAQLLHELSARKAAEDPDTYGDPLATLATTRDLGLAERLLKRLGIDPAAECFAIAQPGPTVGLQLSTEQGTGNYHPDSSQSINRFGKLRTGIGIRLQALHFAESWKTALEALSLASEGSDFDPGATVVRYSDVALLAQISQIEGLHDSHDVSAVVSLCQEIPYAAKTLDAIARNSSLRSVASILFTHHSTIQSRLAILEGRLGWELNTGEGKLRLHLALVARRMLLHGIDNRPPRSALVRSADWRAESAARRAL